MPPAELGSGKAELLLRPRPRPSGAAAAVRHAMLCARHVAVSALAMHHRLGATWHAGPSCVRALIPGSALPYLFPHLITIPPQMPYGNGARPLGPWITTAQHTQRVAWPFCIPPAGAPQQPQPQQGQKRRGCRRRRCWAGRSVCPRNGGCKRRPQGPAAAGPRRQWCCGRHAAACRRWRQEEQAGGQQQRRQQLCDRHGYSAAAAQYRQRWAATGR